MDLTNQKRCLGVVAAGFLAGTVGAAGWSLSGIEQNIDIPSVSRPTRPLMETAGSEITASWDASLAARPLRQPLHDPAPKPQPTPAPKPKPQVVQAPPPPKPPKLDVTLVGTIIEADQSLAIVADANGEFDVKGIGESLELSPAGITIERIESERVTLRFEGRESTIELDRATTQSNEGGGNRGGRRRNNR